MRTSPHQPLQNAETTEPHCRVAAVCLKIEKAGKKSIVNRSDNPKRAVPRTGCRQPAVPQSENTLIAAPTKAGYKFHP